MTNLLLQAIRREQVQRRPLWIMRQAGRYLPEYRAFRQKHSFKALASDAELAAEVTLMPMKRFPLDAAIVFADIMSPLPALGIEFDFDPGPVVAEPIRDDAAVEALHRPNPDLIAPEVIAALEDHAGRVAREHRAARFLRRAVDARGLSGRGPGHQGIPDAAGVRGRATGPARGLLARLSSLMADYLLRQAQAGADAVQIFDSWAGLLSLPAWQRLIRPLWNRCCRPSGGRRTAHLVPAERAALDGGLREPSGRGARGGLARRSAGPAAAPSAARGARQHRSGDLDGGRRPDARGGRSAACVRRADRPHREPRSRHLAPTHRSRALPRSSKPSIRRSYEREHGNSSGRPGTAGSRRERPPRRSAHLARSAAVHEVHGVRRLRRSRRGRQGAGGRRHRRCALRRRERSAGYRRDGRERGPGVLRQPLARCVQPRAVRQARAQERVRHARPQLLDRLRARPRGHALDSTPRENFEPRVPVGSVVSAAAREKVSNA